MTSPNSFALLRQAVHESIGGGSAGEPTERLTERIVASLQRHGLQLVFAGDTDRSPADAASFVMPFGIHKGLTLRQLVVEHRDYCVWAVDNLKARSLVRALRAELERTSGSVAP